MVESPAKETLEEPSRAHRLQLPPDLLRVLPLRISAPALLVGPLPSRSRLFCKPRGPSGAEVFRVLDEIPYRPPTPPGALAPLLPLSRGGSSVAAVGVTVGGIQRTHRVFGGSVLGLFIGYCELRHHQAKVRVPSLLLCGQAVDELVAGRRRPCYGPRRGFPCKTRIGGV